MYILFENVLTLNNRISKCLGGIGVICASFARGVLNYSLSSVHFKYVFRLRRPVTCLN